MEQRDNEPQDHATVMSKATSSTPTDKSLTDKQRIDLSNIIGLLAKERRPCTKK